MNRIEFMGQLERLLSDIPGEERAEALEYYNNYFDDAGEENEAEVIRKLGSPGKVAAVIKADLSSEAGKGQREYEGEPDSGDQDENYTYTDAGYQDTRFDERNVPERRHKKGYQANGGRRKGGLLLLIVLAVFTFPFWGAAGAAIFGTLFGLFVGLIGIVIGIFAAGAGLAVSGVALIVIGIMNIASIGVGLALFGVGMILLALGILLLLAFGFLAFKVFPGMFRWLADRLHRILHKRKEEEIL